MGWVYGARWVCDAQDRSMHRADCWSDFEPEFDPADRESWLHQEGPDASKSLLRRAWADREPVWVADFERVTTFRRGASARKFGLRSAFAFPVIMGGRVVSLLEFFSREARQPDEALLDVARSISSQIAQFVQRKQAEAALKESEQQFRQLAGNIPQVFWITDAGQKETIYISPAWQEITGRPLDEIRGDPRTWLDSVHEEDRERVKNARKAAVDGGYDENFRVVRPDGSIRWVHDRAFPVLGEDGKVYRIAGIAEDITDRKQAEAQLLQLAHYDVLTSLPNRVLFYDRLKQSLAQAKRNQWNVGVLFIDVDRFKNVNDTLGHAVGDQLLQQVSGRLTTSVRSGDTVGRLGGDEFAIVLSNLTSAQDANLVAQKILASFNDAFKLGGAEIYVTASIGISLYPDDSLDQDTLIRNADAAMYRAKEIGRNNYQFYTPEMNIRAQELLSMESNLRRALDRDEFLLHFQPKASAATGEITGVEALLRWRHPERGLVSPAEFIPVLEETGLIVPVGEWVIKAACEQVRAWQQAGITPVPVAVNLSARQFQSPRLGASIVSVIEASGIEPRFLELEITESSLMQNADSAVSTLQFLKSRGLRISIDDFGTGYSSLAYLKRFPLDALKIDRSFVRDLTTDPDDATITRAVISMAHSLGLKVIAEGVETESQYEFLAENGCDEIQGYLFSRPLSAADCGAMLNEQRRLQRPRQSVETAPILLLVDDDDDALTLLKRTLARDSYQILTAHNAHEALEVLGSNRVDVVISDQHMPGVQGVEFLQRVKRMHPRTVRLMTSGAADLQIVTDAINKGEIFRFLPKGMQEDQLRTDVREALQFRARISQDLHSPAHGAADK
jgi:diguanylate cyclase (GGDEF)-like protein/PAS domain S-box-containing protein